MSSDTALQLPSYGPTRSDKIFLGFLVLMVLAVAAVGRMAYIEGQKNEITKKNAEAWVQWLEQASADRFKSDFEPSGCAGGDHINNTWSDCLSQLREANGPLTQLRNPFTLQPPVFAAKCEPGKKALAGALVIEKLTPTPLGSSLPFYPSQLGEQDPIHQKLQLRVSACDEGAYAGRATEVSF
jgi:hypothetical protein